MADRDILSYASLARQQPRRRTFRTVIASGVALLICAGIVYGFYLGRPRPVWRGGSPPGRTAPPASPRALHQLQAAALVETNFRNPQVLFYDTSASANGNRSGIGPIDNAPWSAFLDDGNLNLVGRYSMGVDAAYMGLRHAPGGVDRLVVVRMSDNRKVRGERAGMVTFIFECNVMTPATPDAIPQRVGAVNQAAEFSTPILDLRTLYTGLSDLSDPAAFSIRLDHGHSTSTLHGRLTPSDTIFWSVDAGGTAILNHSLGKDAE